MPVLVPGVCGQAARSVRGLPMTCSGGVAEEFLGVLVPGADGAAAVDLDDRDADPAVGERAAARRGVRARRSGCRPGARGGRAGTRPACGWAVYSTPQRAASAAHSCRPRPPSRSGCRWAGGALERDLAFRVAVGDLDADAGVASGGTGRRRGAGVDDRVGDQFAGEDDGVVDDVGEAPALEGVADEGAGGRDGSPHGLEAGGRARGDHRTPRRCRHAGPGSSLLMGDVSSGDRVPPGISPVVMVRRPSDARSCSCHRPGRRDRGLAAACKVTYLRGPCGCRSAVIPPRVCGRCAKLPNCYGLVRPG